MASHQFKVNIPNPTAKAVSVQLRLEPGKSSDLPELPREHRRAALKVLGAGLALDPCAESGKPALKLKVPPYASVDVYAIVDTGASKKPGAAGLHLIDSRNGKDVGGVFLVCADPPFADSAGQTISVRNPCPAVLATDLYAVQPGADPGQANAIPHIRPGDAAEVVAQITHRAGKALKGVQVYLEHLGGSNVAFAPGTWNVGTLVKGDVFHATWPVQTSAWQTGTYRASIVVVSDGYAPVRLNGDIVLALREKPGRVASAKR